MEDFLKKLAENSSKAAIVALAVLLAGCYLLYYLDQRYIAPVGPPRPPTDAEDFFDDDVREEVTDLMALKPSIEDTRMVRLWRFNAFDAQEVKRKDDFEQDANKRFVDAQKHFNNNDLDKAKAVCEEIVDRIYPAHLPAKDLLAKIKEKEEESAEGEEGGA